MKSFMFWLVFACMPTLIVPAMAAPGLINYQGRLTNPSGKPITTPVEVTFTFWDAEAGGAQLGGGFSDTDTVTADASGIYATLIGDDPGNLVPVSIFNGNSVWLNVRINNENLTPRKRIVSVGYALRADLAATATNADTLDSQHASAFMTAATDNWVNTAGDTMTGPLTVTGAVSGNHIVNVTNSGAGNAIAIRGTASGTGAGSNYGGYFEGATSVGGGVYGTGSGSQGRGVYGAASGSSGRGVFGLASANGNVTNYGGYFEAFGDSGRGVYGKANGTAGLGVVGEALAVSGTTYGVRGKANSPTGYGGFFEGRGYFSDNVGIGKTNPSSRLQVEGSGADVLLITNTGIGRGAHIAAGSDTALWASTNKGFAGVDARNASATGIGVYGNANATGAIANYGGTFLAAGNLGRGVQGTATATGNVSNYGGYFEAAGNNGRGVVGMATATGAVANVGGYFEADGGNGRGVVAAGNSYDFYAGGAGTNYGPFTGAHEVQFAALFPASPKPGLIVVTSGPAKVRRDKAGAVSISSTLPTVRLADRPNDKAVFGVLVKEMPLPKGHWYKPAATERFGIVNALGEGRVWVCSAAGPIEMGDTITTSAVPGYGQKQGDDLQHAYTVGKVIESVDWNAVTETIEHDGQVYKAYLIAVVYTCG